MKRNIYNEVIQGEEGPTGPTGPKGDKGDKGDTGGVAPKDGFAAITDNDNTITSSQTYTLIPWFVTAYTGLTTSANFDLTTGIYTVPVTGWYSIYLSVGFTATSTSPTSGYVDMQITVGSDLYDKQLQTLPNSTTITNPEMFFTLYLTATTTVGPPIVFNNFDQSITLNGGGYSTYTFFSIVQL